MTYPRGFDAPGGGTKSFLQIVYNLQKLGIDIITVPISQQATGGLSQELVTSLLGDGISVDDFQVIPVKPSKLHYLLNGWGTAKVIKSILRQRKVQAVISWEHEAAFIVDTLKTQQIPFAMIAANPSYELLVKLEKQSGQFKTIVNDWFRWRSFRQADCVFVSSKFTRKELVGLFGIDPKRVSITHRGIDPIFAQVKQTSRNVLSKLIFFGSFAPIKGLPDVIAALGVLKAKGGYKNWQLEIAGWGDDAGIRTAIRQADIEENIAFLGRLAPPELAQALGKADLAILPSRAESFGRSIAEAQAAGLPVISYSIGSVPEIVEQGETGWLVPPKQPDLLAEVIAQAIDDPMRSFQMGRAGHKRVTELFSWEKTARTLQHSIEKLNP